MVFWAVNCKIYTERLIKYLSIILTILIHWNNYCLCLVIRYMTIFPCFHTFQISLKAVSPSSYIISLTTLSIPTAFPFFKCSMLFSTAPLKYLPFLYTYSAVSLPNFLLHQQPHLSYLIPNQFYKVLFPSLKYFILCLKFPTLCFLHSFLTQSSLLHLLTSFQNSLFFFSSFKLSLTIFLISTFGFLLYEKEMSFSSEPL